MSGVPLVALVCICLTMVHANDKAAYMEFLNKQNKTESQYTPEQQACITTCEHGCIPQNSDLLGNEGLLQDYDYDCIHNCAIECTEEECGTDCENNCRQLYPEGSSPELAYMCTQYCLTKCNSEHKLPRAIFANVNDHCGSHCTAECYHQPDHTYACTRECMIKCRDTLLVKTNCGSQCVKECYNKKLKPDSEAMWKCSQNCTNTCRHFNACCKGCFLTVDDGDCALHQRDNINIKDSCDVHMPDCLLHCVYKNKLRKEENGLVVSVNDGIEKYEL